MKQVPMRLLAFGGLLVTLLVTLTVLFVGLLYQPLPLWGLAAACSTAVYVVAFRSARPLTSALPLILATGAGLAVSAILWVGVFRANFAAPTSSWATLAWAGAYQFVVMALLLLGGRLLRAAVRHRAVPA